MKAKPEVLNQLAAEFKQNQEYKPRSLVLELKSAIDEQDWLLAQAIIPQLANHMHWFNNPNPEGQFFWQEWLLLRSWVEDNAVGATVGNAPESPLDEDDLPILAALMQPPTVTGGDYDDFDPGEEDDQLYEMFVAHDGDDDEPHLTPGQVVWKECTYYGVTGWHPFTIVDQEYATCRTSIIVEGQVKEVCDTIIMNQGFRERVRDQPPKPATGATITYQGRTMVVYHPGTSDDHLWLMEPGGTVANVYQWPPMAAAPEGTLENHSDSLEIGGFSDSPKESSAIAAPAKITAEIVSDSHSDSLEIGGFSDSDRVWSECGPYKSHGKTYYRYRWGRGRKIEGVRHIPGGAMGNPVVANRAYRVYQAVHVEGRSHTEVLAMIDGWRAGRRATPRK